MSRWLRTVSFAAGSGGATADYWETAWAKEKQDAPPWLLEVLRRELPEAATVLEAGCGQAEFVRLLTSPQRPIVGIDLAARALADARRNHPELALAVADVATLPFADASFDVIISLGVIEHFERGPAAVLDAHRRALRPSGSMLMTVPYRSWSRALADRWHLGVRRRHSYQQRRRVVSRRRGFPAVTSEHFHQYELGRRQLTTLLADAGFEVQRWEPCDPGTAIGESALMARLIGAGGRTPSAEPTRATPPAPESPGLDQDDRPPAPAPATGLRAAAFGPTPPSNLTGRTLRWLMGRAFGHVQFVVATPRAQEPTRHAS